MTSRRNRDVKTEYQNIVRMEYQMNSGYFYADAFQNEIY